MPLPTSPIWDLADFNEATIGSLLTLGPTLVSVQPASGYFDYNPTFTILRASSGDGTEASVDLVAAVPAQYTLELTARFPDLPHNTGDLAQRRAGVMVADDDGRGIAVYFAKTGLAISRIDDFGSVSALANTANITAELASTYSTIRIAVDSGAGLAYVMLGADGVVSPTVQFILPVEATPDSITDVFRVFVLGTPEESVRMEIKSLRLASGLVVPDAPPVAVSGPDQVQPIGHAIRFDGRGSYDAENAPLTYKWTLIDAPLGSASAVEIGSGSTTDDGDADGFTNTISVPPGSLPDWMSVGVVVRFQGRRGKVASFNAGTGEIVTDAFTWTDDAVSLPVRLIRQLVVGADTESPYIVPDAVGLYRLELVVNDGISDSAPSEVVGSAVSARGAFGIEPDVSPLWRAIGDEYSLVENKEVFSEVWTGIAQLMAGKMLELWQYHYNLSLRDAQRTFQRKWVAFRTLLPETLPDRVLMRTKFGRVASATEFEVSVPTVAGTTLSLELYGEATTTLNVALSGSTPSAIAAAINAVTASHGVNARTYPPRELSAPYRHEGIASTTDDGDSDGYTNIINFTALSLPAWVAVNDYVVVNGVYARATAVDNAGGTITLDTDIPDAWTSVPFLVARACRLELYSSGVAFRVLSSTGATVLEFPAEMMAVKGEQGARVTEQTYFTGTDLSRFDVRRGDLLVLNNGQSFTIDAVLSGVEDGIPNARVRVFDGLPADSTETWEIPSTIQSAALDFEYLGVYPGDVAVVESLDRATGEDIDLRGIVHAQKGVTAAVQFTDPYYTRLARGTELTFMGIRYRKALPLPEHVVGVPRLQDRIPASTEPTIYEEVVDYVLEPLYRDIGGAPVPSLQFRDSVWIEPDLDPPDILWAEIALFNNDINVENLFGTLVGFLRDDAAAYSADFNYVAGVSGLLYAQQRGAAVDTLRIGAQILFGQAFSEVDGKIEEIRDDYSPTHARMLIRDADGRTPSESEVVRSYVYKKIEDDVSSSTGLATNPRTGAPWAVGDDIFQFEAIGTGVAIEDIYTSPLLFRSLINGGIMQEVEKYHHFGVTFDLDVVVLANIELLISFIGRTKPKHTKPLFIGVRNHQEDIDVVDDLVLEGEIRLIDSPCGSPLAYISDDYRGDGSIWGMFDDGVYDLYYDAYVDCPTDLISFVITIEWAGGAITYDSGFIADVPTTDVTGAHTGIPGSTFVVEFDMTLPAGTYIATVVIKAGPIVLP